jgi:hypothetical protein
MLDWIAVGFCLGVGISIAYGVLYLLWIALLAVIEKFNT